MASVITDVTALSREELHAYRLELRQALQNPEGEGVYSEASRQSYRSKIEEIKVLLGDD
jgi:hypothetical protein